MLSDLSWLSLAGIAKTAFYQIGFLELPGQEHP